MRTPNENIYFITLSLGREMFAKTVENIKNLFGNGKGEKNGVIYSVFHQILILGPKKFRAFPTGITLGRAIFSPLILIFKKSQGNSK